MVDHVSADVCNDSIDQEQCNGPCPRASLPFHHRHRAHALQCEGIKHNQTECVGQAIQGFSRFWIFNGLHLFDNTLGIVFAGLEEGSHRADKNLAGGKARNQCDSRFPVVAQGFDGGFYPLAQMPSITSL